MAKDGKVEQGIRPDLEGVQQASDDVGALPVPRSVRESKGEELGPARGAPIDEERGLLPGGRRPVKPYEEPATQSSSGAITPEEEAALRRRLAYASRTPEELGQALRRQGSAGVQDPQRGNEAGPPLPGLPLPEEGE